MQTLIKNRTPSVEADQPANNTEPGGQISPGLLSRVFRSGNLVATQSTASELVLSEHDRAIINTFETRGYVEDMPDLSEAALDETRTTHFRYHPSDQPARNEDNPSPATELTEWQGLEALLTFLDESTAYYHSLPEPTAEQKKLAEEATTMRTKLSFLGEKELEEATRGIALVWKNYLAEDTNRQICVPIGTIRTHEPEAQRKSNEYLFERIIDEFTDAELAQYGQRIVIDPEHIKSKPEDTRIILLDDWTISGIQLNSGVRKVSQALDPKYKQRIEINLLVATEEQIRREREWQGKGLPLKAYYRANERPDHVPAPFRTSCPLVTGIHSSVDIGFEETIFKIVADRNRHLDSQHLLTAPPLTNIERQYKDAPPRYTVSDKGTLQRL